MSELSEVIASEIADFFAGFVEVHTELGGPNTVEEAQTQLTDRLLAVLALRDRAEPVEHESHIRREVNAGGNTWIQCSKQAFEREKARGALCRVLYESPPAPVVPAETFDEWSRRCEIQLTLCRPEFREVAEITWNACRAAMVTQSGSGWIKCSERMPEKDGNYWAWWSESKRQGPAWFIKSELQAQFQSSEITHWMPLPEAPAKN
ncbi:DUF551 domain-containing protein [Cronobacter dublinensis]|nr:DUF551 domain-containing protein [Cronobacter dublinensis]